MAVAKTPVVRTGERESKEQGSHEMQADRHKVHITRIRDSLAGGLHSTLLPVLPDFSFPEFNRISSFTFTDMPDSLYYPAPRTNDFFSYGSYCSPKSGLPIEIRDFIENPLSRGTIVVAFGTLVSWNLSPPEKLSAFVQAFDNLTEYRIIWSYKGRPVKVADHVLMSEWIPQNELLLHEKTVLFISHGGLKSVKEAACSGTPSLFVPMFAEQMRNAWLAKNKGFAEIVNKFLITRSYLEEKIRGMLNKHELKEKGKAMKERLLDRPLSTLDHASFLVNRTQLLDYIKYRYNNNYTYDYANYIM
ncbi:UDP-glucuronosyltransferase [Trichostrongylus colubriformis]|uniref:glucuronosyltransferase n=1 Tax=Trichostrongylus colubriformis TaxID=6319 RepID=A0AAN8IJV1_TRICO